MSTGPFGTLSNGADNKDAAVELVTVYLQPKHPEAAFRWDMSTANQFINQSTHELISQPMIHQSTTLPPN